MSMNAEQLGSDSRHMVKVLGPSPLVIPPLSAGHGQVIVDSINAGDTGAEWRYVVPSKIPLGTDQIAVGIIYDASKIALKVMCMSVGISIPTPKKIRCSK